MLFTKKMTVSQEKAHQIMQTENGTIILDVRTPEEYAQGYIPGATLLPVDEIAQKAAAALPDKDALILVYCHSGMRAGTAVKQLDRMGYKNTFSFGGIMNWPYGITRG